MQQLEAAQQARSGGVVAPISPIVGLAPASSSAPRRSMSQDKLDAKVRLQKLVRDFAKDAVGKGIQLEVDFGVTALGPGVPSGATTRQMSMRMDRRLSRLELWLAPSGDTLDPSKDSIRNGQDHGGQAPVEVDRSGSAELVIPLVELDSVAKGEDRPSPPGAPLSSAEGGGAGSKEPRINRSVFIQKRGVPGFNLVFESGVERDKAYTCLKIFQMSVESAPSSFAPTPALSPRENQNAAPLGGQALPPGHASNQTWTSPSKGTLGGPFSGGLAHPDQDEEGAMAGVAS